jgi:uncharacterized protein YnzC (UPF0291/DUF896 family)
MSELTDKAKAEGMSQEELEKQQQELFNSMQAK